MVEKLGDLLGNEMADWMAGKLERTVVAGSVMLPVALKAGWKELQLDDSTAALKDGWKAAWKVDSMVVTLVPLWEGVKVGVMGACWALMKAGPWGVATVASLLKRMDCWMVGV